MAPWNIKAQSPDDFLTHLYDLYPDTMVEVVRRQSQVLRKPPMTVVKLLDLLSKRDVPKFASNVLFHEYSLDVVQTARKALKKFGRRVKGGRCLEGDRYHLWQQGETITITTKDNRGEILRVQNGEIEGNLSCEDVEVFQIFDRNLEQELAQARNIQLSKPLE